METRETVSQHLFWETKYIPSWNLFCSWRTVSGPLLLEKVFKASANRSRLAKHSMFRQTSPVRNIYNFYSKRRLKYRPLLEQNSYSNGGLHVCKAPEFLEMPHLPCSWRVIPPGTQWMIEYCAINDGHCSGAWREVGCTQFSSRHRRPSGIYRTAHTPIDY